MEEQNTFSVKYKGKALDNHKMDAKVLGQSMVGLAELFSTVAKISTGKRQAELSLNFKETRKGSLEVVYEYAPQVLSYLESTSVIVLNYLLILKELRGRKYRRKDKNTIKTDDGQEIVVDLTLQTMLENEKLREKLKKTFSSLTKKSIDSIQIQGTGANAKLVIISREEYKYLDNPLPPEEKSREEVCYLWLVGSKFAGSKGDNKWTFTLKNQEITAGIKDATWMNDFRDSSIKLGDNYRLKVNLQITEHPVSKTLTYVILKVHDQKKFPTTQRIPPEEGE